MGVSRNRTGKGGNKAHRAKSSERTLMLKRKKEKAQREMMDFLKKAQEEYTNNQNVVSADEVGNIGEGLELNLDSVSDNVEQNS